MAQKVMESKIELTGPNGSMRRSIRLASNLDGLTAVSGSTRSKGIAMSDAQDLDR